MKKFLLLIALFQVFIGNVHGQKQGKAPAYEPVSGIEAGDVAPLIFLSLESINKDQSDLLSKEEILLEEIDFENMRFQTNYIHYVSMMMHRRVKANYEYKDGILHVELSDIGVQNQTKGGEWEESKMPVKGDKKIQAKLALKIDQLKDDQQKVEEAKKKFYGSMENLYVIMTSGSGSGYDSQESLLKANVTGLSDGLVVVDAEPNNGNEGKYKVTYSYDAPDAIAVAGREKMLFTQITDSKGVTGLLKGEKVENITGCKVSSVDQSGTIVLSSGEVKTAGSSYDYKKLVDTDPVEGLEFDDAFPVIYHVLKSEGIKIHKVNFGQKFITTGWIKIQDGKLGSELQGLLTFLYDEERIWSYYIQMTNSKGSNSQCLSSACKDLKIDLSGKIAAVKKSGDMDAIRKSFYENPDVDEIMKKGENNTTLMVREWEAKKTAAN